MRILVLTPYFYPHIGGSQRYAEELHVELMRKYPKTKVDIVCYNTNRVDSYEKYRGLTIYRVGCIELLRGQFALPNYVELILLLRSLRKKYKYDVVNSQTRFFDNSWWAPWLAKYLGAKAVLTDHCADHPAHASIVVRSIARAVDKFLVPPTYEYYDACIATNKATAQFIASLTGRKPKIVYGGVDTRFFSPLKRRMKRSFPNINKKFSSNDIIVTFLGRMIPSKGAGLLFSVAKEIVKKKTNVYFIFAGEGKLLRELKRKGGDHIYILGKINKKQTADVLANSDIVVHPSLHHEGFPNVILEAGASGCAVIATNQGGTKEIIEHYKTGSVVKPNAADLEPSLLSLLNDEKKRRYFASALRNKVEEKFTWSNIVQVYNAYLNKLIEKE